MAAVLLDGLLAPDPARETYRVPPGGATEIRLAGDDRLRIVDRHGGQLALVSGGLEAVGLQADAANPNGSARLFGPHSAPGDDVQLAADRDTRLLVAAPGGRVVDGELPPTELLVEVRRAIPRPREEIELPAPLAEPRLDFRVDAATALSYEVKAGEFIQVIDVRASNARTSSRSTRTRSRTDASGDSTRRSPAR
jgi:aminomethyltransferase